MRRNRSIPDILPRLRLFELMFEFTRNEDWLELLGYKDEASVSRVKNGKQRISVEAISRICEKAGIERKEFMLPLPELADLLDVTEELGATEALSASLELTLDHSRIVNALDSELLHRLPGSYVLVYPGREERYLEKKRIVLEKMDIFRSRNGQNCRIVQKCNIVTGEQAEGMLSTRGGVVRFGLSYKTYFPDSAFLLQPILSSNDLRILTGIYLDVAPLAHLQIFATQCCMFSVDSNESFPRTISAENKLFQLWLKILDNKTEQRGRLISRSGDSFYERVRNAVLTTIESGGHQPIR